MPTIIAVDVSLSMAYRVSGFESNEKFTRLQLAAHAIGTLLDYLALHSKLEYVAIVTYSSKSDVLSTFTRDYESLKTKVSNLQVKDKTDYESLIKCLNRIVVNDWGSYTPCQVIVLTDGSSSFDMLTPSSALTVNFPSSVTVMCIAPSEEMYSPVALKKILDLFESRGKVVKTDPRADLDSITAFTKEVAKENYSSSNAVLKCGGIVSKIQLLPPPMPYTALVDFEMKTTQVSNVIEICGFVDNADIGTPAAISRHLVLPIAGAQEPTVVNNVENMDVDEDSVHDDGKVPSFCVLLHGALKVENMVALCQLSANWFGILFSWTDTKKRSNLMLIVLEPDRISVPWIGDFKFLGSLPENVVPEPEETFPVRPPEKRSYNQNIVVWVKQSGLQSDVQKILRQARKLPEKTNNFYKELNRLRRAAISFGFVELLDGVADIFERECTMLPGTAHPDCALQLTHSAGILRRPIARDAKYVIPPMRTKFVSGMETSYGKI